MSEATGTTRILLADDDGLVRGGIAAILGTSPELEVVALAEDGHGALDLLDRHRVDVALLDIQMPRLDGLTALERIRERWPELPVAMLTTFSDERYIARAISAGALGFLLKSDDPEHLLSGVRALASGGAWFSPAVGRWLVRREAGARNARSVRARELVDGLPERQRELLVEIGHGASNARVAGRLHLSEGTVKQYVSTLLGRLGVENRVQAAIIAHEAGVLGDGIPGQ